MKFSIIIPTFNRASFLTKAIESVLTQTCTDWELIIVDDGSTDNTKDVVLRYKDPRIRYIYQQNAERSSARNNGINHANGDYVCFMDSDNLMLSHRLQLLADTITTKSCYYTDIEYRNEANTSSVIKGGKEFGFPINKDELIQEIIATPQICCATPILRKHQFNPQITIGEDMELLFRITDEFPLVYLPNQATIVEFEHEGRSVAQGSRASEKQLQTLQIMFSGNHPANKVSSKMKRWLKSAVLFNASKNYILEGKIKGLLYLLRSIIIKPIQKNTKYKCNILFSCIFRKQKLRELLAYE
ncbi:MAG: glycosyltransferase family 2 protein [Bacteroidales bacterium]|nr:glycosyltransferase family 2 protein [Bacteroidales bacterium]